MAVDLKKLIYLCKNNYQKDIKEKLIEKAYEEVEKEFNNILPAKINEFMSDAIDQFYSFPPGKVYERTNQFSKGRTLFNFFITSGGRVWELNYGEGFPSYPATSVKGKWSRKHPWPGDEAWGVLFEAGMHGTGKMNIGVTKPTPYEIVDEKIKKEIDELVARLEIEIKDKYLKQLQQELINQYKSQCTT